MVSVMVVSLAMKEVENESVRLGLRVRERVSDVGVRACCT
jgi:hypothetical protein